MPKLNKMPPGYIWLNGICPHCATELIYEPHISNRWPDQDELELIYCPNCGFEPEDYDEYREFMDNEP